jgi:hypothetical protein
MKYKESWKIYNDNKNVMDFAIAKAEKLAMDCLHSLASNKNASKIVMYVLIVLIAF